MSNTKDIESQVENVLDGQTNLDLALLDEGLEDEFIKRYLVLKTRWRVMFEGDNLRDIVVPISSLGEQTRDLVRTVGIDRDKSKDEIQVEFEDIRQPAVKLSWAVGYPGSYQKPVLRREIEVIPFEYTAQKGTQLLGLNIFETSGNDSRRIYAPSYYDDIRSRGGIIEREHFGSIHQRVMRMPRFTKLELIGELADLYVQNQVRTRP